MGVRIDEKSPLGLTLASESAIGRRHTRLRSATSLTSPVSRDVGGFFVLAPPGAARGRQSRAGQPGQDGPPRPGAKIADRCPCWDTDSDPLYSPTRPAIAGQADRGRRCVACGALARIRTRQLVTSVSPHLRKGRTSRPAKESRDALTCSRETRWPHQDHQLQVFGVSVTTGPCWLIAPSLRTILVAYPGDTNQAYRPAGLAAPAKLLPAGMITKIIAPCKGPLFTRRPKFSGSCP